jgi:hypothetical protein
MKRRSIDTGSQERQILYGLGMEWALAVSELSSDIRKFLKRPLFRLSDVPGRLGQWDADKREICLDRRLALEHPWDEIRDVLLHEMAHQLAQTVLGADGQPPHGPAFKQACLMLRADPSASADVKPLHKRLESRYAQDEHPIRERIQKLLSLAQSGNVHEAEAAMHKAHELMARHHIETMETDPDRSFVSIFLGQPALRHFKEFYFLANLIQDFYFVEGIWVPAFVVSKSKMGRVLEISGTYANVSQAGYVYDFIRSHIDNRWEIMTAGNRLTRYQKSDFAVGVIEGLREKLEARQLPDSRPEKRALIHLSDPRLSDYLRQRFPRTSRIQRGGGRQDQDLYRRGIDIGTKMVLHRGITRATTDKIRKLPHS